MVYYKQEKFVLAEFHFKKALTINPYNSTLLCTIAVVSRCCRLTNYELLRLLVETPSRDFAHYRLSGGRRIFTTCHELTS